MSLLRRIAQSSGQQSPQKPGGSSSPTPASAQTLELQRKIARLRKELEQAESELRQQQQSEALQQQRAAMQRRPPVGRPGDNYVDLRSRILIKLLAELSNIPYPESEPAPSPPAPPTSPFESPFSTQYQEEQQRHRILQQRKRRQERFKNVHKGHESTRQPPPLPSIPLREQIQELFSAILAEESMVLSKSEREQLFESIVSDMIGYGPLDILLQDDSITKIMVNGPKNIFIWQKAYFTRSFVTFENDDHVLRVAERICANAGIQWTSDQYQAQGYLSDLKVSFHFIFTPRPYSLAGPLLVVHKSYKQSLTFEDIVRFGWAEVEMLELVQNAFRAGFSFIFTEQYSPVMKILLDNSQELTQTHCIGTRLPEMPTAITTHATAESLDTLWQDFDAQRMIFAPLTRENAAAHLRSLCYGATLAYFPFDNPKDPLLPLLLSLISGVPHMTLASLQTLLAKQTLLIGTTSWQSDKLQLFALMEVNQRPVLARIFGFEQTGIERGRAVGRFVWDTPARRQLEQLIQQKRQQV